MASHSNSAKPLPQHIARSQTSHLLWDEKQLAEEPLWPRLANRSIGFLEQQVAHSWSKLLVAVSCPECDWLR